MSDEEYLDQGLDISASTFLALSGALRKAIKTGGLENALAYCNENALALTDSLSDVYDVEITSAAGVVTRVVEGQVEVTPGVTR